MIAVDTSALMAVILGENMGRQCMRFFDGETSLVISAATLAEALIVSNGRHVSERMERMIAGLNLNVVPVTAATASRVMQVYRTFGRGNHKAALNFGDCFAYDAAKINDCPLLFVGNDFSKTDIPSAL